MYEPLRNHTTPLHSPREQPRDMAEPAPDGPLPAVGTDPNLGKWKLKDPHVCRIFFSSPFNGMEKEREALTSLYWPQIQSRCNAQGIVVIPN